MVPQLPDVLKLINKTEILDKLNGLQQLGLILTSKNDQLKTLGHDLVILKELVGLVEFDNEREILEPATDLLQKHYFYEKAHWDQLAELFILKIGRSNNRELCELVFLPKLSSLIDSFDESIAKHSKQILQLVDLNEMTELNVLYIDLLERLKAKLPQRKTSK